MNDTRTGATITALIDELETIRTRYTNCLNALEYLALRNVNESNRRYDMTWHELRDSLFELEQLARKSLKKVIESEQGE